MVASTSAPIGRFTPAYFDVSGGLIQHRTELAGCVDPFSYMGETFGLSMTLTAYNGDGAVTRNYQGGFAKLEGYDALGLVASDGVVDLSSRLGLASGASASIGWANGEADVDLGLVFARDSVPEAPYLLRLGGAPEDGDGIQTDLALRDLDPAGGSNLSHVELAQGVWRYGRAQLNNGFGSELEKDYLLAQQPSLYGDPKRGLEIGLQLEYFDGGAFVRHGDDNCSRYQSSAMSLIYGAGSTPLPAGTTAVLGPITASAVVDGRAAVDAPVLLLPPGVGNQGSVELRFDVPAWLEFDWDGATAGDEDPRATATFGRYRGHDRLFLWQEQH
jgi:MSHA biogenesis protein MshQ